MSETLGSSPNPNPDPSAWESLILDNTSDEDEQKKAKANYDAYRNTYAGYYERSLEQELDEWNDGLNEQLKEGIISEERANELREERLDAAIKEIDYIRNKYKEELRQRNLRETGSKNAVDRQAADKTQAYANLANVLSQVVAAKAEAEGPDGREQQDAGPAGGARPERRQHHEVAPVVESKDGITQGAQKEAKALFSNLSKLFEKQNNKEEKDANPAVGANSAEGNEKPGEKPGEPEGASTGQGEEAPELDLTNIIEDEERARKKVIDLALQAIQHPDINDEMKAEIVEKLRKANVPEDHIQMILASKNPLERQPFVGVNVKNFQIDVGKYAEQFADGNEEKIEHQRLERSRSRFFKRLLLNIFRPLNHYDRNRSIAIAEGVAQDYNDYSSKDVNAITQEIDAFYINKAIEGVGKRRGKDVVRSYDVDKAIGEAQWAIKEYARSAAKVKDSPDKEVELKKLKQNLRESLQKHIHVDIEAPGNNYFAIAEQAAELVRQGEDVKKVMEGFKMREVKFVNKLSESGKYDFRAISDTLRRLREADAAAPPRGLEAAA